MYINDAGNLGGTSFINSQAGRSNVVKVMTGDAFVQKNILEPIDFIKIDVESFEGPVIRGLAATIEAFQPIISMEWNNQETIGYFLQNKIFTQEFKGYHRFAMYPRWLRCFWPGLIGKVRRRINKIIYRNKTPFFLSEMDIYKFTDAVILIPPKHEDIIVPLLEAAQPSRIYI